MNRYPTTRIALLLLALLLALPTTAFAGRKTYSGKAFTGENPLGVSRAEFASAQEGLELIYQRKYPEALQIFEVVGIDFPDSPLGPVGRALVYQAWMFENYDFVHDGAYKTEHAETQARLKLALRSNQNKAWNQFLQAVHLGLDAMYDIRHYEYLSAFNKAWDALELIKKVERQAPEFHDVQLALGLYNYWRSAISEQVDGLPSFGDHREEGLAQMRLAKDQGLLARAPASLVLTYSHMEKKDWDAAIEEGLWARENYPTSVLNEMTLARVYRSARRFDDAQDALQRAVAVAPDNQRLWFQIGETHYKARKQNKEAIAAYQKYLLSNPPPEYAAHTYYRLGLLERRSRRYDEAIVWLEKAVETWPKFKSAAKRLEDVKAEKERRATKAAEMREKRDASGDANAKRKALPRSVAKPAAEAVAK